MNIKQHLLKILTDKRILNLLPDKRVYFLHANDPNRELYLEYEIINEYGVDYEEGEETCTRYKIQIDIFSTNDYTELENIVKKIMIKNGFNRDEAADLYEKDTKLYHKSMRFSIDKEVF